MFWVIETRDAAGAEAGQDEDGGDESCQGEDGTGHPSSRRILHPERGGYDGHNAADVVKNQSAVCENMRD